MYTLSIALPALPWGSTANYLDALNRLDARGAVIYDIESVARYDGLLIPGGWDADPALYGEPNVACQGVNQELDALQLKALRMFVKAEKPVLGICRGEQLINVFFGGSLIQDLPTAGTHSRDPGKNTDKVHGTHAEPSSYLEALYGADFPVNSSHHQGVSRLGEGLKIVQRADDGVVEGIVHERLPLWGVQWHPERMCFKHARADTVDGAALLRMFLKECERRRG